MKAAGAGGLGALDVTALGVGAIVGGGIFATMASGATGAGPSLALSFAFTALLCALPALCYAELAALIDAPGSAYSYTRAAFGRWAGFVMGWNLVLEFTVANVAVALSWARYVGDMLAGMGLFVPAWLATDWARGRHLPEVAASAPRFCGEPVSLNLLAASIILLLTLLLVVGTRASMRVNTFLVGLKVAALVMFVVLVATSWVGAPAPDPGRWRPFFPRGLAGCMGAASMVFFSYIGFDAVACLAREARRPARTLPIGILGSLAASAVLYCLTALAFTGAAPPAAGAGREPFVEVLAHAAPHLPWAPWALAAGAVVAQSTALLAFQAAQARVWAAMAEDGMLPAVLAGRPGGPPRAATWAAGLGTGLLSALCDMDAMIALSNVGTLFAFAAVCLGVIVLRRRRPNAPRPFRVPGPAWGLPALGLAACALLMAFLPAASWAPFFAWLAVGAAIGWPLARRPAPSGG